MAIDYYSKYLKYKSKYLELKSQMGSGNEFCFSCKCEKFVSNKQMGPCENCTHDFSVHSRKPREVVKVKSATELLNEQQMNTKKPVDFDFSFGTVKPFDDGLSNVSNVSKMRSTYLQNIIDKERAEKEARDAKYVK